MKVDEAGRLLHWDFHSDGNDVSFSLHYDSKHLLFCVLCGWVCALFVVLCVVCCVLCGVCVHCVLCIV